jgi:hypothetical protein
MGKLKLQGMLVGAIAALVVVMTNCVTSMAAQQAGRVNVDANVLKNIGTSHDV